MSKTTDSQSEIHTFGEGVIAALRKKLPGARVAAVAAFIAIVAPFGSLLYWMGSISERSKYPDQYYTERDIRENFVGKARYDSLLNELRFSIEQKGALEGKLDSIRNSSIYISNHGISSRSMYRKTEYISGAMCPDRQVLVQGGHVYVPTDERMEIELMDDSEFENLSYEDKTALFPAVEIVIGNDGNNVANISGVIISVDYVADFECIGAGDGRDNYTGGLAASPIALSWAYNYNIDKLYRDQRVVGYPESMVLSPPDTNTTWGGFVY